MTKDKKTWFITGTSRGFGREWTQAALERGDRVATARNPDRLNDLVEQFGDQILPLHLDVTDQAANFAAVQAAHEHFGQLDVIVNNAGYGLFGADSFAEPKAPKKSARLKHERRSKPICLGHCG
jgi:NAD(P)-dependent dehydrogenase (short-subunit alcohol dehydrogenase family)